jgi:hypothetical protein
LEFKGEFIVLNQPEEFVAAVGLRTEGGGGESVGTTRGGRAGAEEAVAAAASKKNS